MFSIIIPTLNNLNYLKLCINSIEKNSFYNHEIIVHANIAKDGTLDYLKKITRLSILILHITQVYQKV